MQTDITHPAAGYRLCFEFLDEAEVAYEFPCDARGHVDLNTLSRFSFNNYLYARALVGMQFKAPSVFGGRTVHASCAGRKHNGLTDAILCPAECV